MSTAPKMISSQTRPDEHATLFNELSAKVAKLEAQVEKLLELVPQPCEHCSAPTPAGQLQRFGWQSTNVCPACFDTLGH